MSEIVQIIVEFREGLTAGLWVTFRLCLLVWLAGLLVGGGLGVLAHSLPGSVGRTTWLGYFILSGMPVLVFLFWMHYPLQVLIGFQIDPFVTATLTLAIVNVFSVAEVVRGVLSDFPRQYLTAAEVCGLDRRSILWKIQFPLVLRQALPTLLVLQVGVLHLSLFASLISVNEIFRVAQRINAQIYRPVEIYTVLGIFFLIICLPVTGASLWLQKKYGRDLSER